MNLTARNIDAASLFNLLAEQKARQVNLVVPATALTAVDGKIVVATGIEPKITEYGVTSYDGVYDASEIFVDRIATYLGIPQQYLRKLADERPDLFDANINGWLQGTTDITPALDGLPIRYADPDPRKFYFRGYTGDDTTTPTARGLLSDRYFTIDNVDVLTAVLDGLRQAAETHPAAADVRIAGADISDKRMFVRFIAPAVEFGVRELLRDYRSPWAAGASDEGRHGGWTVQRAREAAGREGRAYVPGAEPIGWAGFEVRNSELGYGRTTITPRAEIEACGNGLKIVADLLGRTHLGARMDEGVVEWSEETQRIQLKLITSQAADAVRSFLDPTYWNRQVAELAVKADRPVADPTDGKVIATVAKELGFSEAQRKTVFDHFLRGGQFTAGGVMNAITSAAQVQADGDTAAEMEGTALRALELV